MAKHETEEDRAREAEVAAIVESAWGVTLSKMPDPYRLDYAIFRDGIVVGFMEVRCRSCTSMTYPSLMISEHKVKAAQEWRQLGVPVSLVVKMQDGLFILDLTTPDYAEHGGRSNPRDKWDLGMMAYFSSNKLKHFTRDSRVTYTVMQSS